MRVEDLAEEDLDGALLVLGFPGQGLVGPIVTAYVIQELGMWPVAGLIDDGFPPTMAVQGGQVELPVQFYVSAERCGPDGRCDKLVVLNTQIPLPPERSHETAAAILAWASERGISHVIAIEGVELEGGEAEEEPGPRVFGVAGKNESLTLESVGVKPLPDGVITSHSSAILMAAAKHGIEALALFVAAQGELDQVAASESLLKIDPVVPNLNLKSEEFQEKVDRHRSEHERRHRNQARQLKDMKRTYEMMYQ